MSYTLEKSTSYDSEEHSIICCSLLLLTLEGE